MGNGSVPPEHEAGAREAIAMWDNLSGVGPMTSLLDLRQDHPKKADVVCLYSNVQTLS